MRSATLATALLALAVTPLSPAADDDAKAEAIKKEREKFAGDWILVAGEVDGRPIADADVKASRLTHDGEKARLVTPHLSPDPIEAASTLDPLKKPREKNFTRTKGPNKGVQILAIYEWDGDDKYRICFDPSGKTRPRAFTTKSGTGFVLHVWQRAAKK